MLRADSLSMEVPLSLCADDQNGTDFFADDQSGSDFFADDQNGQIFSYMENMDTVQKRIRDIKRH